MNFAVDVSVPSDAWTVWIPADEAGTVKEHENESLPSDWQALGVVDTVVPPKLIVIGDDGAKIEPVTVTLVPTGPKDGFMMIEDVSTVR